MKFPFLPLTFFLAPFCVLAQEQSLDSLKVNGLDEVVVTAQFEPQSVSRSVHNVRVISRKDIDRLAANTLSDVLNQYLNITIVPNGQDGRSTVSIFGLNGQYFKILVDSVPLVSDTGTGNDVDLTQVNLNDIQQIEIIEGSMGVTHGANAVSGILNIVTKKKAANKWEITASVQEETVSDEYGWFDKGRHLQSAKVSHNINDNWFASVGGTRNDFAGFYDGSEGRDHAVNDGQRGHRQLPKEQLGGNALLGYSKSGYRAFYRFEYFGETVDFYNPIVAPFSNYPFPDTHFSNDKRYLTNRFYHHLNTNGQAWGITYNISLSHQLQKRDLETYQYWLEDRREADNERTTYQSKEIAYSTGSVTDFFKGGKLDLQLGYEFVQEKGFYDASAGLFRDDTQGEVDIRKRIENYDFYASGEIHLTDRFALRPGVRYSFQSLFDDQYAVSLGLRQNFDKGWEWRASVGRSYRTPNFDELYTYMVDTNHDIRGNENLTPETSMSYETSVRLKTERSNGMRLSHDLSVTFMDVDDRISMVYVQLEPTQRLQYENVDSYRMWNLATHHQMGWKGWDARLGLALVGVSQRLDLAAEGVQSSDDYLYTLNANASLAYQLPKAKTQFSVFYKFNGKQQQYVAATNADNDTVFVLSEIESFGWMDASVRQPLLRDRLELTLGARNLFDVTSLRQTRGADVTGGAHGSTSTLNLGYGRSYFLKLTYNLNF